MNLTIGQLNIEILEFLLTIHMIESADRMRSGAGQWFACLVPLLYRGARFSQVVCLSVYLASSTEGA